MAEKLSRTIHIRGVRPIGDPNETEEVERKQSQLNCSQEYHTMI